MQTKIDAIIIIITSAAVGIFMLYANFKKKFLKCNCQFWPLGGE